MSLEPVGALMGLDWRLIVATLSAFVAKENAIADTRHHLRRGGRGARHHSGHAVVTPAAGLAFLVVNMLFIPCIATIAAVRNETRSWGWTAASAGADACQCAAVRYAGLPGERCC
jgi:ferrous iron transport protein B